VWYQLSVAKFPGGDKEGKDLIVQAIQALSLQSSNGQSMLTKQQLSEINLSAFRKREEHDLFGKLIFSPRNMQ
jgi:hypothetical protein